jgi:hypothetical protein
MKESSNNAPTWMAILAIFVGVFCVIIAPIITQTSLERVLTELMVVAKEKPQYSSGLPIFGLFYPVWRAIIFIAGIALLAIAAKMYQGEEWTYPVALTAYAMPSIGGMFMFLPYISWVGGFPLPMVISWVGLVGFATTILLRAGKRSEKLIELGTMVFIGMLATHSFTLGIGSQRMLMVRPGKPLFEGLEYWILTWVGEVDWIATLMLIIAIPLLALHKPSGWWLALIATLAVLAIDAPTQVIRTATLDYLYGALLALGTLFFLFLPSILDRYSKKKPEIAQNMADPSGTD